MANYIIHPRIETYKGPGLEAGIPGPGNSLVGGDRGPNGSDQGGPQVGDPLRPGRRGTVEPWPKSERLQQQTRGSILVGQGEGITGMLSTK